MPLALLSGRGAGEGTWREIRPYVAARIAQTLDAIAPDALQGARELRLRAGRPAVVLLMDGGELLGPPVSAQELAECLEHLTQHSLYAWEAELGHGFLTIPGGHRVGVAGRVVETSDGRRTLRDASSLNYRIARSVEGAAGPYLPRLSERGRMLSTLVVGPPGCGKTTLLRDLVRSASDGVGGLRPHQVALVDERSEIAACHLGMPGRNVGARTDVLDGCAKAVGMRMALRALGPQLVATDEIGGTEDAVAVADLSHAGVAVLATAHASGRGAAPGRPDLDLLVRTAAFSRLVLLREAGRRGQVLDLPTPGGEDDR